MKTHTIAHALPAEIEFEFPKNKEQELDGEDYAHIKGLLRDGFIEGELIKEDHSQGLPDSGKTLRGWWKLKPTE